MVEGLAPPTRAVVHSHDTICRRLRMVLAYLKASTGPLLDPLQFSYRANRSVDDAVNIGCVLSPLLFSLYTNDCTFKDPSVKLLKFADDTTLIGLIQDGDESAYRQEVKELAVWCSLNNLEINTLKTVEMIVDFRRNPHALPPLTIMNSTVTAVDSFRFLGTTIYQDLKWDNHIESIVKKAQQRLYFLRQLRKFNLPQELLIQFYSAIIESVLCTSITVWFSSATKSDLRRLQRVVQTAERIIGTTLPKNCTYPEWAKGLAKSLWTPHIQHTPSLNCYRLVDATELWAPERPDTGTVSSLKLYISWTLDIKRGTHEHYLHYLFITHTYFFISILHISDLYTHICLYYILCFCHFVHCLFVYYSLLSVSCPVAVILLHCGASVTITNSSYV